MSPSLLAESRIDDLGINDPKDIDVEAIGYIAGMRVEYADLSGCEATLAGYANKAIATIRPSEIRGRERFSIAHELGHWEMHRGKSFYCRGNSILDNLVSDLVLERQADEYASHLLMPTKLFNKATKSIQVPSLKQIDEIAQIFQASILASMIRMVKVDTLPVIVTAHINGQYRWHSQAPHVPMRWRLKKQLDEDSFAYDLLLNNKPCDTPRKQSADAWFTNEDADEFEIFELCYSPVAGQVVTMLYLSDEEMLEIKYRRG